MIDRCLYKKVSREAAFLFLIIIAAFKGVAAVQNPDFAYPQTVQDNAEVRLRESMDKKDYPSVLQYAIQIAVSKELISTDDAPSVIKQYEGLSAQMPSPYKELAILLEAQQYVALYQANRWEYNKRTLPLSPAPEDIKAWSRDIFAKEVEELVHAAMSNSSSAKDTKLKVISPILQNWEQAANAGFSVYDFMTLKSVEMLNVFSRNDNVQIIPFRSVSAVGEKEPINEQALNLLNEAIAYHKSKGEYGIASILDYQKYLNLPYNKRKIFLRECVQVYDDTPYCAQFILSEANNSEYEEEADVELLTDNPDLQSTLGKGNKRLKREYKLINQYLEKFPNCENSEALKGRLSELMVETISATIDGRIYPNSVGHAVVKSTNAKNFFILIVKTPERYLNKGINADDAIKYGKVVDAIPVRFEGANPEMYEQKIDIKPLQSGIYVLIPSKTDKLGGLIRGTQKKMSFPTINVSSIQYFISNDRNSNSRGRIYVVDGKNQKPLSGAKISLTSNRDKKTNTYTTNSEGYIEFSSGSYQMSIRYGLNRLDNGIWLGNGYNTDAKEHISGQLLTDLSIYHPGDSIGFVGMIYKSLNRELNPLKNGEVKVYLRDANWENVDSVKLTIDEFGRAAGRLRIPESGLLGQYSLVAENVSNRNNIASAWVEVSDYKSPTFYVTVDGTEKDYKVGDKILIKGKVSTYSGMPVADANVKYDISYHSLPWLANINATYGGNAKTDSEGAYEIELETGSLVHTDYAFGSYRLNVSATNPNGETQSAPAAYFSLGKAYSINADIPSTVLAKGQDNYGVRVSDIIGTPKELTVYYKVQKRGEKEILRHGEFISPNFVLDSESLVSGEYQITFSLNPEFKDSKDNRNCVSRFTVYRDSDKCPPCQTPLWVPEKRIIAKSGNKNVEFTVGSSYSDSWIYMQVADCNKVLERRWVKINGKNDLIDVEAPAENNRVTVTLIGVHVFDMKTETVTIIPEIQTKKIEIKTVSFRENITPGSKESWKFNFSLNDKSLAGIPVSTVMSNKALNVLAPFSWGFNPYSSIRYDAKGNIQPYYGNGNTYWSVRLNNSLNASMSVISIPDWNFYGYGLGSAGSHRYLRNIKVRGSNGGTVVEMAEVVNEMKMSAASVDAAPTMGMAMKEESAEDSADAGSASINGNEEVLRDVECPLAFFMPTLITDSNGDALVDFTVPQFNGAWQFQIMGYTPDMRGAVQIMDAVASKPIMVQMNAPRFLRSRDVGSVSAAVYNNSLDSVLAKGKIEIFNPLNGEILKTFESSAKVVRPSGSVSVSIDFDVPSDISYIGIRTYGYGGNFTDGEQTVVPVYPNSTPVLESQSFYVAPGDKDFTMNVKGGRKDAKMTLVYCDNPIWEVVKALPGMIENQSSNALAQISALYGNAIAAGLMKNYPELKEGIKLFASAKNSGDSALISNLEKNQGIKNVLLNNTPWVRSAESETLRMQSLIKYTDEAKCRAAIEAQVNKLLALQNSDGGWSWCDEMKSSDFVTSRVLLHLGMLKNMGYLPEKLLEPANAAVKYADNWWVKDLKEYKGKNYPYSSMLSYLYVRPNFRDVAKSGEFAAMEKTALAAIKDQWKKQDIYGKATAAIVLKDNGYDMESRSILESLRQYAKVSKEKGMWFDNLSSTYGGWNKLITTTQVLEAYNDINPKSANVDLLRQWLLLSKQTEAWGYNRYMAEVINAILSTGTKWTKPSASPKISIGGKMIEISKVSELTGSLTATITDTKGGILEIKRNGDGPAWGGIVSQFVEPIKDVKAEKCSELAIDKKMYVITNSQNGSAASESQLKVGDKVRVTLTIKCGKDLEYVAVTDSRSACFEPAEQVSGYTLSDGVWMYKEIRNDATNIFIPFLSKGTHVISYDCYVDRVGTYALGISTAQSQYAPEIAAHSAGDIIVVSQ